MATRWFILLALILAGSDQASKWLARTYLDEGVRHEIIPDFFRITLNFNSGIAWGMLPEYSGYLTIFAIIMVIVILIFMRKLERDEVWLKISLAFMMAGAIGNMVDRLIRGEVTDFLDVRLFLPGTSWSYDWPIFNLADSYIVVGATILFFIVFLSASDTVTTRKEVKLGPALVSGGSLGETIGWEDAPHVPGAMTQEEALIELPVSQQTEMLRPYEDDEQEKAEVPQEQDELTSADSGENDIAQPYYPEEPGQLKDLDNRPQPSE